MHSVTNCSAIDPVLLQKSCQYADPATGKLVTPDWVDPPTGDSYRPSYNIGPTTFTYVLAKLSLSMIFCLVPPIRAVVQVVVVIDKSFLKISCLKALPSTYYCFAVVNAVY